MTQKNHAIECPNCKKQIQYEQSPYRPFCSKRCQLIDLGDWASEKHRIAGEKVDPDQLPAGSDDDDLKEEDN